MITEIKQEIRDMLTQPISISIAEDEDDMNSNKRITNIDKIVENASRRESGELTDQLWDLLKGNSKFPIKIKQETSSQRSVLKILLE